MIDILIARVGRACGWLLLALVLVQFAVVLARYVVGANFLWAQEAAIYLHGAIFMLAASWTLMADKHVQIDAVSNRFSTAQRSLIEKLGTVFLLFPMMVVILVSSFGYVLESWSILEGSLEISGLPGRYLVKSLIPVFALLMVLAAAAKILRRS